jgi:hypothetical protein
MFSGSWIRLDTDLNLDVELDMNLNMSNLGRMKELGDFSVIAKYDNDIKSFMFLDNKKKVFQRSEVK